MSVLIYADSYNKKLTKTAYEAVTYGLKTASLLGTQATVIVTGECENIAELGEYGATKVLHVNKPELNYSEPQLTAFTISEAANKEGANLVVMAHDHSGKGILPRLSVRLNAGSVPGAVELPKNEGGFSVKKAVFSGKAFAQVEIKSEKKIVSFLPNTIPAEKVGGSAQVENFEVTLPTTNVKVKEVKKESTKLSLTEADIVVSAGRGLKGPENWGMIEELANELGAATACSRPVADIGWRPHHEHVGQTGVTVRPNLYFAIGISGAIQHLAGVNGSKVMVVINTDPEAPFFKAADYGIVGDAFEVVPKLIEAIKAFKAANN